MVSGAPDDKRSRLAGQGLGGGSKRFRGVGGRGRAAGLVDGGAARRGKGSGAGARASVPGG